ncbi:M15 family metallopeptidase [Enterobacter huaxiensis]|uniref:M15 family metallopeptidase n=1 Tax=Enterobacter huaxiensis TaxID=2494702 RepID=UPI002175CB2B|nr:M15 family metallopeptidase [Enterobacter huaxiensis]MCS5452513.1 M15 family metallopeptidase [Enterobacter huaxiensis]
MAFVFGKASEANLAGVHPDLKRVVRRALTLAKDDFKVVEGLRTEARQRELFNAKKSKTMKSRHLTGHAVDLLPLRPGVNGYEQTLRSEGSVWVELSKAMFKAAELEGVKLRWGGDFNGDGYLVGSDNWDAPHYELHPRYYP